jgi:xanthine dehydrogenase accessory factor
MREIWNDLEKWRLAGKTAALATVVYVSGSSLRPAGSKMAISSFGEISGSVTGGCVEGAIFEEAKTVVKTGIPKLAAYGVTNEQAWEVGLSCGGSVRIFVESMTTAPWKAILPELRECMQGNQLAALITVISGVGLGNKLLLKKDNSRTGSLGDEKLTSDVISQIPSDWATRDSLEMSIPTASGEVTVFVDFIVPPPRLIIVGASHIAIPLVTLAKALDYHTIVIDARSAFATRERFPHADELIVDWPSEAMNRLHIDAATCVVCLSHDDKQDTPALQAAINSDARYIGVLGSKATQAKRLEALREEGASESQLQRIHGPVGLKLGAKQPAEIAVSIIAEIIATQHGVKA